METPPFPHATRVLGTSSIAAGLGLLTLAAALLAADWPMRWSGTDGFLLLVFHGSHVSTAVGVGIGGALLRFGATRPARVQRGLRWIIEFAPTLLVAAFGLLTFETAWFQAPTAGWAWPWFAWAAGLAGTLAGWAAVVLVARNRWQETGTRASSAGPAALVEAAQARPGDRVRRLCRRSQAALAGTGLVIPIALAGELGPPEDEVELLFALALWGLAPASGLLGLVAACLPRHGLRGERMEVAAAWLGVASAALLALALAATAAALETVLFFAPVGLVQYDWVLRVAMGTAILAAVAAGLLNLSGALRRSGGPAAGAPRTAKADRD